MLAESIDHTYVGDIEIMPVVSMSDIDRHGYISRAQDRMVARVLYHASTATGNHVMLSADIVSDLRRIGVALPSGAGDLPRLRAYAWAKLDENTDAAENDGIEVRTTDGTQRYRQKRLGAITDSTSAQGQDPIVLIFSDTVNMIQVGFPDWAIGETHSALVSIDYYLYDGPGVIEQIPVTS